MKCADYPTSEHTVPLALNCPVKITRNIYDKGKHTPRFINGTMGIFRGWSDASELQTKAVRLEDEHPSTQNSQKQHSSTQHSSTQEYAVVSGRWKGAARIEINGNIHLIGQIDVYDAIKHPVLGSITTKKRAVFPVECAFWTRVHRIQGQTISGRMHIDLAGIDRFDLKTVYVALSRGTTFCNVSVENFTSEALVKLIANHAQ